MDYNEAIKNSRCFGVAYDNTVKECKVCEVCKLCKQKTEGAVLTPDPTPAKTSEQKDTSVNATPRPTPRGEAPEPKKAAKKVPAKPSKEYDPDMPDFKTWELDDILKKAEERGVDLSAFDKFVDTKIKRMRVTMALKATYEK